MSSRTTLYSGNERSLHTHMGRTVWVMVRRDLYAVGILYYHTFRFLYHPNIRVLFHDRCVWLFAGHDLQLPSGHDGALANNNDRILP